VADDRIVVERWIDAPPEVVFSFLTDAERWIQWQGTEADLDPRPGGVFQVNVRGDGFTGGEFVAVEPSSRVAFTWGFERPGHPLPRGSTLVEIDLTPERGGTHLRLTHRRLPPGFDAVRRGWEHYADRLRLVAAGHDPGPDPNRAV
jgi:uncharacterized protein YndB with AHSA1/START domain